MGITTNYFTNKQQVLIGTKSQSTKTPIGTNVYKVSNMCNTILCPVAHSLSMHAYEI